MLIFKGIPGRNDEIVLRSPRGVLGRASPSSCPDIEIPHIESPVETTAWSREHALFEFYNNEWHITVLTTVPTFLNGKLLVKDRRTPLLRFNVLNVEDNFIEIFQETPEQRKPLNPLAHAHAYIPDAPRTPPLMRSRPPLFRISYEPKESLRGHCLYRRDPDVRKHELLITAKRTARSIYIIQLEGDTNEEGAKALVPELQHALREISSDPTLIIREIRKGSLYIEIEGDDDGCDRIIEVLNRTARKELLGRRIVSIKIERRFPTPSSAMAADGNNQQSIFCDTSNNRIRDILCYILVTDSMLDAFILDYFPNARNVLSETMDRYRKISLLLQMADKSDILASIRSSYPIEFQKYLDRFTRKDT